MKFFLKNTLPLIFLFCAINPIHAKSRRGQIARQTVKPPVAPITAPLVQPIPKSGIIPQQPAAEPKNYADALNFIKTTMPSNKVISNNTFTPEFINFVKSLNLSATETKALLQAGINLHATWTDNDANNKKILLSFNNSIQNIAQTKVVEQPKSQPKSIESNKPLIQTKSKEAIQPNKPIQIQPTQTNLPLKDHLAINDAIILLDPNKSENEAGAMISKMLIALYQKAAPVIITSNLLEVILNIKQKIGDSNLQKLRQAPSNQMETQAEELLRSYNLTKLFPIELMLISGIDFDDNNIRCYFHKSEQLILLIPRQFLEKNLVNKTQLNFDEQARACGFNPTVLKAITHVTIDNLKKELLIQQSLSTNSELFTQHLASMFTPQKKNQQLISPEQDIKWAIYLAGHGNPAQSIGQIRQQLVQNTDSLNFWKNLLKSEPNNLDAQKYFPFFESRVKTATRLLQGRSSWPDSQLLPESAQITGIGPNDFVELMKFFDKNINMAFLHYSTCFAGGLNQSFVNESLSSLNVDFIVSAEGLDESSTTVSLSKSNYSIDDHEPRIKIQIPSFTDFFRFVKLFVTDPEAFVLIKGEKKDPIIKIISTIVGETKRENQPFVRFPATSSFKGVSLAKNTRILTQTMVHAHEIEKKSIDMSDPAIKMVILNTPRITAKLDLGGLVKDKERWVGDIAIVTPSPKNINASYEGISVFKSINYEDALQSFLCNCICYNARLYTQTFVVNELTGAPYDKSQFPGKQNPAIHNLIIQMKSVIGDNLQASKQPLMQLTRLKAKDVKADAIGMNICVAFELNNNIYQTTFAVKNFENVPLLCLNMQNLTFTSTPQKSTDMSSLASNFLTPEEITQVKKPITLGSIAQFIDSKIDKQDSSMTIWSEADNEALLEFVTKHKEKQQVNK